MAKGSKRLYRRLSKIADLSWGIIITWKREAYQSGLVDVVEHIFPLSKVSVSSLINRENPCWESFTPK